MRERITLLGAGTIAAIASGLAFLVAMDSMMYVPTFPDMQDLIRSRADLSRMLISGVIAAISFHLAKKAFRNARVLKGK